MRPWIPLLLAVLPVALLAACPAAAQDRYVPLEQRIDAARLADVGLTPDQLQQLNRLLRETQPPAQTAADAPPSTDRATPTAARCCWRATAFRRRSGAGWRRVFYRRTCPWCKRRSAVGTPAIFFLWVGGRSCLLALALYTLLRSSCAPARPSRLAAAAQSSTVCCFSPSLFDLSNGRGVNACAA